MMIHSYFDDMDEGLALMMVRIRKDMRSVMRTVAQEEELSPNEVEMLLFLSKEKFNTAKDIIRHSGFSRSLVSKSMDILLKRGYIDSRQDETDRRIFRLALLPKAHKMVDRLERARFLYMRRLCEGITEEERDAFMSIVQKMSKNAQKYRPVHILSDINEA